MKYFNLFVFYFAAEFCVTSAASILFNSPRILCRNSYNDTGICVSNEHCRQSRGISVGACAPDGLLSCCLELPCSTLDDFILGHKRSRRSVTTPLKQARVDPVCGLRINADAIERKDFRQEQLINGVPLDFMKNRYPWMLALWINAFSVTLPSCGAALVSNLHAITAAHCVNNHQVKYVLRGGSVLNELQEDGKDQFWINGALHHGGIVMEISSIDIHPFFNPFNYEHDIALITLTEPIRQSRELFPVCLPPPISEDEPVTDYVGQEVSITGWGCEKEHCQLSETPKILQEVSMTVVPNDMAMCWFFNDSIKSGTSEYVPKRLFVVGGDESGSTTTCHGDSGSPVVRAAGSSRAGTRFEVIGLVSWSKGCGRPFRPSVWTRVETFVPWLLELMNN